jgi:trigger factor
MTAAKMFEEMKPEAEKRIKERLVLDAAVKAENIEITDAELEEEMQKMADAYNMKLDQIKEFMGDAEKKQMKDDLAINKVIETIVSSAVEK